MTPPVLDALRLNRATLARQGLLEPIANDSVAAVVASLGSLQAQHPDWPPFALATRLDRGTANLDLLVARRRRKVVRASLMRMTVHVVAAEDFWPMSTLTMPSRLDQFRIMYKLDPATSPLGRRLTKAHGTVLDAMREKPLAIAEIDAILRSEIGKIEIPPHRSLWRWFSGTVPLVLVPFDGEGYGRARYVPAADWLGPPPEGTDDPDVAAARLAERYLAAFGPASVEDYAAYVGRGKGLARLRVGVAAIGERLVRFHDESGRELVDLADAPRPPADAPARPRLLARWDSLLLSHATRHRTRVLPEAQRSTVITKNADVLPTFLVDGMVAGTWLPRRDDDGSSRVELRPFGRLRAADRDALEAEADRLLPVLRNGAFSRVAGTD
jgi:hypothetical protein